MNRHLIPAPTTQFQILLNLRADQEYFYLLFYNHIGIPFVIKIRRGYHNSRTAITTTTTKATSVKTIWEASRPLLKL